MNANRFSDILYWHSSRIVSSLHSDWGKGSSRFINRCGSEDTPDSGCPQKGRYCQWQYIALTALLQTAHACPVLVTPIIQSVRGNNVSVIPWFSLQNRKISANEKTSGLKNDLIHLQDDCVESLHRGIELARQSLVVGMTKNDLFHVQDVLKASPEESN